MTIARGRNARYVLKAIVNLHSEATFNRLVGGQQPARSFRDGHRDRPTVKRVNGWPGSSFSLSRYRIHPDGASERPTDCPSIEVFRW